MLFKILRDQRYNYGAEIIRLLNMMTRTTSLNRTGCVTINIEFLRSPHDVAANCGVRCGNTCALYVAGSREIREPLDLSLVDINTLLENGPDALSQRRCECDTAGWTQQAAAYTVSGTDNGCLVAVGPFSAIKTSCGLRGFFTGRQQLPDER